MKVLLRIAALVVVLALAAAFVFYWDPLWVNDQHIRFQLWRANVRSEYVMAGGHRLHYFEAAPTDGSPGVPLVLIHGLGSRAEDWAPMIPTLAANGFHVYAPDLLGFGRSARPDVPYSIPLEEGVLVGFMHSVGLTHADLDGWSMGGWIAAKLALDQPAMVDRLVVNDSAGIKFQPSFARDSFVPTDAAALTRLVAFLTPMPRPLPGFVVRATLRKIARGGRIVQMSMDSMESGADLLDARLGSITQPTLIVWGTEDKLIPISVGQAMHRGIPNSVFEAIAGCGHLAPGECPAPVLAGTIEFLKAQPPMPRGERTLPGNPHPEAAPKAEIAR
jgi:pimeloyl-ACP methyl ester carboxylesterase